MQHLVEYGLYAAKLFTFVVAILFMFGGLIAIFSRSRDLPKERIEIKNLNEKYRDMADSIQGEVLSKDQYKKLVKEGKKLEKAQEKEKEKKRIYVLDFDGDIRASAVASLREEITAVLKVASTNDEIVVLLESPGGMVHAYGLAASQLARIRERQIPLTIIIDKVAASGGYLMACVANKILAAPFAMIGSIGVIAQLPNFHRLLKKYDIDFEQLTAGDFKRTLTMFGENTPSARKKFQEELEDIHSIFKNYVLKFRHNLDIKQVATGETWLAIKAIEFNLVDAITTSDDYLLNASKNADIYQVDYTTRKTLSEKIAENLSQSVNKVLGSWYETLRNNTYT